MAPKKSPVSFDAIINSDRQKKQNELLASQILGKDRKNRRASAPGPGAVQKGQAPKPGSLASRIGIPKRSASTSSRPNTAKPVPAAPAPTRSHFKTSIKPSTKPSKPTKPAPKSTKPAPKPAPKSTKPAQKRRANSERLLSAIESGNSQANIREPNAGLCIKGASGPFVVVGSNFAPGTTAADIQSALEPASGPMLSCRVISHSTTVTAELAYADKPNADNVIAKYHNQKADGRLLTLKLKTPGASTQLTHSQKSYNDIREQANRERNKRRSNGWVQDGSYGFGENGNSEKGLYSDVMMLDAPQNNQGRKRLH